MSFIVGLSLELKFNPGLRDHSQTLVGGGAETKNIIATFLGPLPFRPQKFQSPLFDMKIMGQPHRKSFKPNFPKKIGGHFFFKAP